MLIAIECNMTPSFLTNQVKQAIAQHSDSFPNQEVCGLILKDGSVIPSVNAIAGTGLERDGVKVDETTDALIDEELFYEHEDNIACFYHSHWNEYTQEGYLSFDDIEQSRFHQIPYLLYHTAFKTWDYYDPSYNHPAPLLEKATDKTNINYYVGWKFEYGRSDCSALLRSYFYNHFGLEIPDYPRPRDGQWYLNPQYTTAYQDLMNDRANGFVQVNTSTPKKNDVVLLRWFGSPNASHAGIMVDDNSVLHIIENRLSEVVVFGGAWKRGLHSVWRLAK